MFNAYLPRPFLNINEDWCLYEKTIVYCINILVYSCNAFEWNCMNLLCN